MNDYSSLNRLAVATEVMYAAAKWNWTDAVAEGRLGKTTTAYVLAASPSVVAALIKDRDHLANEVQRVTELRRLEWSARQSQAATIKELMTDLRAMASELNELKRGVQA